MIVNILTGHFIEGDVGYPTGKQLARRRLAQLLWCAKRSETWIIDAE